MSERTVLFRTVHGSHLYGLARPDSDRDYYEVTTKVPHKRARWAKQEIVGDEDTMRIDIGTWILLCEKGVPQALEAMFSPVAEIDLIGPLRAGFRAGGPVRKTYLRTIENFLHSDDFKRRRHAVRLAFNACHIGRYGRFNPVLSPMDAEHITHMAVNYDQDTLLHRCTTIANY